MQKGGAMTMQMSEMIILCVTTVFNKTYMLRICVCIYIYEIELRMLYHKKRFYVQCVLYSENTEISVFY